MIQLAIWGICAMLIVKALDVMHRDSIASHDDKESPALAKGAAVFAVLSAALLFVLSLGQAASMPSPSSDLNPPPFDVR